MAIEIIYAYILGLFSILGPCTFIIVPIMLSDPYAKLRKLLSFLSGVTITFGILGVLSALTGKLLTNFMGPYLYLFAGTITLISGLSMLNLFDLKLPNFFASAKPKNNFFVGMLYGGVMLSCIGPLIASVLAYITAKADVLYGLIMMYSFSLGFITPFALFAFLITDKSVYSRLARYTTAVRKAGGVLLMAVSIYLFFIASRGII